ncbi:MAG: DUF2336 domain-containing protein [Inquilinaceae bacterium]
MRYVEIPAPKGETRRRTRSAGSPVDRRRAAAPGTPASRAPAYDTLKTAIATGDVPARADVAARMDSPPEILFFLAADTAAEVRRLIAENPATPTRADLLLVRDPDQSVRGSLARKMAGRIPPNGEDDAGPLEKFTLQVLTVLAQDASVDVRRILAEAIRDLEQAPHRVVRTLAGDSSLAVAEPILRHSPQLTEADLLAIVDDAPIAGALSAIAGRDRLTGPVADAIARTDDVEAVTALLGNNSAQIREDTLDLILDRAPDQIDWHKPLVHRRDLPPSSASTLARFVALSLVEVLRNREDLDPETAAAVAALVQERAQSDGLPTVGPRGEDPAASAKKPVAMATVAGAAPAGRDAADGRAMATAGTLTEDALDEAILAGERAFVIGALAAAAGFDDARAERMIQAKSARAAVALVWKAGFSMRMAVKVQLQIARLSPQSVLNARDGHGYPLSPADLEWQLDFFADPD